MAVKLYAVTSASGGLVLPMRWQASHAMFAPAYASQRWRERLGFVAGWGDEQG